MRYLLSGRTPPGGRILLIESGSRAMAEGVLPTLADSWAASYQMDLVTCYGGLPAGFPDGGKVYRTGDYATPAGRQQLVAELRNRGYAYTGIICSAEPVMTWWKWYLAFKLPAKVFIVNENCDYFWINRENAATLREFALVRMGMEGGGALRVIARLAAFPIAILYLLLYAFTAHARRAVRTTFRLNP